MRLHLRTRPTPEGAFSCESPETTELMLQMLACDRGVAALPRWLVEEYAEEYSVHPVRLGAKGVQKPIHLGVRKGDLEVDYLNAFMEPARGYHEKA